MAIVIEIRNAYPAKAQFLGHADEYTRASRETSHADTSYLGHVDAPYLGLAETLPTPPTSDMRTLPTSDMRTLSTSHADTPYLVTSDMRTLPTSDMRTLSYLGHADTPCLGDADTFLPRTCGHFPTWDMQVA